MTADGQDFLGCVNIPIEKKWAETKFSVVQPIPLADSSFNQIAATGPSLKKCFRDRNKKLIDVGFQKINLEGGINKKRSLYRKAPELIFA